MLTSQHVETKSQNEHVNLPTRTNSWQPVEIVYSKISLAAFDLGASAPPRSGFRFSATPSSWEVRSTDVGAFVDELLRGRIPAGREKTPRVIWTNPPPGPIDILVENPCYVVIELDPNIDWFFRTGGAGVTAKQPYDQDNCDLMHVNGIGDVTADAPNVQGCRIVYFSVVHRKSGVDDRQHFNLHVEFPQAAGYNSIEIIIDPDVPNNGGVFPFDPLDPLAPVQP